MHRKYLEKRPPCGKVCRPLDSESPRVNPCTQYMYTYIFDKQIEMRKTDSAQKDLWAELIFCFVSSSHPPTHRILLFFFPLAF